MIRNSRDGKISGWRGRSICPRAITGIHVLPPTIYTFPRAAAVFYLFPTCDRIRHDACYYIEAIMHKEKIRAVQNGKNIK